MNHRPAQTGSHRNVEYKEEYDEEKSIELVSRARLDGGLLPSFCAF